MTAHDVPRPWRQARLLLLAPLLPHDIDLPSFASLPARGGRALLAQGLQRRRAAGGRIEHLRRPSHALLDALTSTTSVFLSVDEVAHWSPAELRRVAAHSARLVITRAAAGAEVWRPDGAITRVPPARTTRIVDATGAGDVFATAFILALSERNADESTAGRIAAALAAAKLRRAGPAPLPALRRQEANPE